MTAPIPNPWLELGCTSSAGEITALYPSGESDPAVTLDCAPAETISSSDGDVEKHARSPNCGLGGGSAVKTQPTLAGVAPSPSETSHEEMLRQLDEMIQQNNEACDDPPLFLRAAE